MEDSILSYWKKRVKRLKAALESNNFEVFIASNADKAHDLVIREILPAIFAKSVSWGGSKTLLATKLCTYFKESGQYEVLDTFDYNLSREDMLEVRRQALMTDLFLTGTNAVTQL